jgi:hypothetical protein
MPPATALAQPNTAPGSMSGATGNGPITTKPIAP